MWDKRTIEKTKKNLGELHALMWVDMSLGTSCGFGFTRYVALITFLSLIPLFVSVVHYSDGGFFFFCSFRRFIRGADKKGKQNSLGFRAYRVLKLTTTVFQLNVEILIKTQEKL